MIQKETPDTHTQVTQVTQVTHTHTSHTHKSPQHIWSRSSKTLKPGQGSTFSQWLCPNKKRSQHTNQFIITFQLKSQRLGIHPFFLSRQSRSGFHLPHTSHIFQSLSRRSIPLGGFHSHGATPSHHPF